MEDYQRILLAIDLHENLDETVIEQAAKIAHEHHARMTIIHVLEHLTAYGVAQAYTSTLEVEEAIRKEAADAIQSMVKKYNIQNVDIAIEAGSPKNMIIDKAKEINADLIIVGSHGRHGLSLLLGSTANAVLHYAPCDVLAVRIKDRK